jgi:DNA-binding response OmpR family regulator
MADPKTILIVEDDSSVLELLAELLSRAGYKVLRAKDGKEGLLRTRGEPGVPDLIIADVMMPVMGGFEMRLALLAEERTKDIPLIFLTAKSSPQDRQVGLDLGARRFMVKPVFREELLEAVRQTFADSEERHRLESLGLRAIAGSLEQTSPLCLVELFRSRMWDGQVVLRSRDQEGELRFIKGELVEVQSGEKANRPALEALLAWKEGTFFLEGR